MPLLVWLNVEETHEAVKLNLIEAVAKFLAMHEVLVFEGNGVDDLLWWVLWLFSSFILITSLFFGSFLCSLFAFFSFFATFFLLIFFFLFGLSCSILSVEKLSMNLRTSPLWLLLHRLDSNECVVCGPWFFNYGVEK